MITKINNDSMTLEGRLSRHRDRETAGPSRGQAPGGLNQARLLILGLLPRPPLQFSGEHPDGLHAAVPGLNNCASFTSPAAEDPTEAPMQHLAFGVLAK